MLRPNRYYEQLERSYLFDTIAKKTKEYMEEHPGVPVYRMGIGDVTLPLCDAVIKALHKAVDDQADAKTFQGYVLECGMRFLREIIADYYRKRGVWIDPDEVFVNSGANDELGSLLDIFDQENDALVMEPAYPAYVDASVMCGRKVIRLKAERENGFLPMPDENTKGDLIYLCSPGNPTGAAYTKEQLQKWVDFANRTGALILFDAAYEAYIEDPDVPHSILELEHADTCAIEICSLSKTAGFTGMRVGYTIIPKALERCGMNLNEMRVRNREVKSNGISCVLQKGAAAVFTPEGQAETKEQIEYYKENGRILMQALDEAGIWYTGGKNAPYIWMKCPFGMDSWTFFDYLLKEIQVVGTPGAGFGTCGEGYFRFSTFGSREDTKTAAKLLVQLLKRGTSEQEP